MALRCIRPWTWSWVWYQSQTYFEANCVNCQSFENTGPNSPQTMAIQTETLALAKFQQPLDIPEVGNGTEQLMSDLKTTHTLPLWAQMEKLNPHAPNPSTVPHVWRYNALRPHLLRAGDLISEKQAERRVLMLVNPARGRC